MSEDRCLVEVRCLLKQPVFLKCPDLTNASCKKLTSSDNPDGTTGCQVIDVILDNPASIKRISFRNYYTYTLTVLAPRGRQYDAWETCIKECQLMPACHYEAGGQDWCIIEDDEFIRPLADVKTLRLILKQPSSNWNTFGIKNFSCYSIQSTVK